MTICLEYDDIVDTRDDESDKSYDTSETCTFPITFAVCCRSDDIIYWRFTFGEISSFQNGGEFEGK